MIGRIISHYKILEELGKGGMGEVYKAQDTKLDRPVAIKFLPREMSSEEDARERFIHEAKAASALDHTNIGVIHEIDETADGQTYIVMALYEGETLRDRLDRGEIGIEEALNITLQITSGMSKAHEKGIIHRDLKPSNVLITKDNEVKIVDFGIAKLAGTTRITKTGRTVGTIAYMSPEQAKGDEVDERSDIFSLGVVLYELLTGHQPFAGQYEAAVLYEIVHEDPKPLSSYRSDVSEELQQIVSKAIHKDITARYQTIIDLRDDVKRVMGGMRPALPRHLVPYRYRKFIAPLAIVILALLALLLYPRSRNAVMQLFKITHPQKLIVVLPFENVGGDTSNQAFCDGLMETLTSQLTQLEELHGSMWIIPASEVRKREIDSPSEAGQMFEANLVVSASVQRISDLIRVTLNLIDVANPKTPRQVNSRMIDARNAFFLHREIGIKVADMLNVELLPERRQELFAVGTGESEAYEFYLEGRGYLQRYEKEENIEQAIRSFERAIERDSKYALAYAGLGEAYWRKYNNTLNTQWVTQAMKNCERAIELNDQLAPVRVTLAMIYIGTGEYEKAIPEVQQALAYDPTNVAAYRELASAYAEAGKLEEAESTYRKAIEMKPQDWRNHYNLGSYYYYHDRPEDAVSQFRRVIELTPDNVWGYNSLGATLYYLERWKEARAMFKRSIELGPSYRAYSNLATINYIEGRYTDAAALYEKALELNNTSYRTWAYLANAYYWIPGKRNEAYDIYRRAAEMAEESRKIHPNNPHLLTRLAAYYAMIDEGEKALALIEQALELQPDNSRIAYWAGFTYEHLDDREKALEWIGKALELGYTLAEVESDPWLSDLRADERFQQMRWSRDTTGAERDST